MSFVGELKRRKVIRVGIAYLIAAWVIAQVSALALESFEAPAWAIKTILYVLVIGFPLAMIFSWAFDMTPDGIKLTQPATASSESTESSRLDYVLIAGLVIVAVVAVWQGWPTADDSTDTTRANGATTSIAVLPFADMSPGGDQEYFGDGIAEELLDELARLDGLQVASRTSSFAFKGSNDDSQAIANALNVDFVLEGSVRKDGERIRITAQLINAADGYHAWSETYDRDLIDIFAIQDEISYSVAGALGVRLGVGSVNAFRGAGTQDVEAYETYLKATQLNMLIQPRDRRRTLERAIELDPDYAAAWAALGLTIASTMWINPVEDAPAIVEDAIEKLLRAVELGPDSAYARTLMATVNYALLDWIGSEESYAEALSIRVDAESVNHHANMLMRAGRSSAAEAKYVAAYQIAPVPLGAQRLRANVHLAQRRFDETNQIAEAMGGFGQQLLVLQVALNTADAVAVHDALAALPHQGQQTSEFVQPVLDRFDTPEDVRGILRQVYSDSSINWPSKYNDIAMLAAFFDDEELALEAIAFEVRRTTIRAGSLWYPVMSKVRQTSGFKDLVREINLVDYWRAYGWADHCYPAGEDDFECQ
jgi:TolB-like protein